jgi:flagellar hook-length control protein FliK
VKPQATGGADSAGRPNHEGRLDALPAAPRAVSIQLGPRSGSQPAETAGVEVDRVRFVQRVARAFQAVGEDGGQVRLRLSPPELGSLRLEVSIRGGVMTAHVEAETQQARALLLESLPVLRERLGEQNIRIERFEVDLMNQSPDEGGSRFTGQAPGEDVPQRPATNRFSADEASAQQASRTAPRRPDGGNQLNVVV